MCGVRAYACVCACVCGGRGGSYQLLEASEGGVHLWQPLRPPHDLRSLRVNGARQLVARGHGNTAALQRPQQLRGEHVAADGGAECGCGAQRRVGGSDWGPLQGCVQRSARGPCSSMKPSNTGQMLVVCAPQSTTMLLGRPTEKEAAMQERAM